MLASWDHLRPEIIRGNVARHRDEAQRPHFAANCHVVYGVVRFAISIGGRFNVLSFVEDQKDVETPFRRSVELLPRAKARG